MTIAAGNLTGVGIAKELRALADEPETSLAHVQKLRDHLLLAAEALEAPTEPRDPWLDERHLFGLNYAKVRRSSRPRLP